MTKDNVKKAIKLLHCIDNIDLVLEDVNMADAFCRHDELLWEVVDYIKEDFIALLASQKKSLEEKLDSL